MAIIAYSTSVYHVTLYHVYWAANKDSLKKTSKYKVKIIHVTLPGLTPL